MPLAFAPDALPGSPGVITAGAGLRPTGRGYANWQTLRRYAGDSSWDVLGQEPDMLHANNWQDKGRIIAGCDTALYELTITSGGGTFTTTDVTPGGGLTAPSYAGTQTGESDPDSWAFTNYGQVVLATNKWNGGILKQADKGEDFVLLANTPAAGCITVWKNFIITGNCSNYGAVTGATDMVAWSALGDFTDFVPCAATQAGWNRLLDVNGRVIALMPIGDALAVYKATGIYLMRFQGPPVIFVFQLLDGERGINATSDYPPPVVDVGNGHIFVTRDDICYFDGSNVTSIARGRVREYLIDNYRNNAERTLVGTHITHDRTLGDIYFWNYGLTYNYVHGLWGSLPSGESVVATNYSAPLSINWGASGVANDVNCMVAKSDKKIYSRVRHTVDAANVTYADMTATFSEIGRNDVATTMQRAVPLFKAAPTSTPTLDYYRKEHLGAAASVDGAATWSSSKSQFDLLRSAYWHQTLLTVPGAANSSTELIGMEYGFQPSGKRTESELQQR